MHRTPNFTVTYEDIAGKDAAQAMIEAIEKVRPIYLEEAEYHLKGMHHAMLIKPDGTISMVYPANGSSFELKELQSFVEGHIEYVSFAPNCTVYINDNGVPEEGIEGLPLNTKATALIWKYQEGWREQKVGFHGNVLFMRPDSEEE